LGVLVSAGVGNDEVDVAVGLDSVGVATVAALGLTSTKGVFLLTSGCEDATLLDEVAETVSVLDLACLGGGGAGSRSTGSSLTSSMISSATTREPPSALFLKLTDLKESQRLRVNPLQENQEEPT